MRRLIQYAAPEKKRRDPRGRRLRDFGVDRVPPGLVGRALQHGPQVFQHGLPLFVCGDLGPIAGGQQVHQSGVFLLIVLHGIQLRPRGLCLLLGLQVFIRRDPVHPAVVGGLLLQTHGLAGLGDLLLQLHPASVPALQLIVQALPGVASLAPFVPLLAVLLQPGDHAPGLVILFPQRLQLRLQLGQSILCFLPPLLHVGAAVPEGPAVFRILLLQPGKLHPVLQLPKACLLLLDSRLQIGDLNGGVGHPALQHIVIKVDLPLKTPSLVFVGGLVHLI